MLHSKFFFALLSCFLLLAATASHSRADDADCARLLANTPSYSPPAPEAKKPQHVFLIVLENKSFDQTFGKGSPAPYLNCLAHGRGGLLERYYGIGHNSLDNYLAMISGQAPTPETQQDCPQFINFELVATAKNGQLQGHGCVYPTRVSTLANQLSDSHHTWGAYMEDMGNPCEHPQLGYPDGTEVARVNDQYATKHNPFVYFHSIIDDRKLCANDKSLASLESDLKTLATTPNLVFVTPNLCNDAHDAHCVGAPAGEVDGLAAADRFLQKWVPLIMKSPAYQRDGMLVITFDESQMRQNVKADFDKCCGEQPGPNVTLPGLNGPGGGLIGAVIVSPYVSPGSHSSQEYNHYSLLKSIEVLFDLPPLGYATPDNVKPFGPDIYTAHPSPSPAQ